MKRKGIHISNHRFNQFSLALEKDQVSLFARVTFGATGAPTLVAAQSKGIKSITRNSAGNYTIVFGNSANPTLPIDTYQKFLFAGCLFDESGTSAAPASPLMYLTNDSSYLPNVGSLTIQFTNVAQAATDPASGEAVDLMFDFRNSSAY